MNYEHISSRRRRLKTQPDFDEFAPTFGNSIMIQVTYTILKSFVAWV